jgi:hypothetical protein
MSFSHIKGSQFAKVLNYTIVGADNKSDHKVIFSEAVGGKCIYTLNLEIDTGDALTECLIRVGKNLSSAGAIFTNAFKYDQAKQKYYISFSGIEEDVFSIDLYVSTENVNSDFTWAGTLEVCVLVKNE